MSTAFRASAQVVNGTAGTSVVVPRPTGTADGDVLVAFIARTGTSTATAPADWTLVSDVTGSGNGVRLSAYVKVASSEPSSWTWTLGGSQRNWGVVAAYTGADPDNLVANVGTDTTLASSTILQPSAAIVHDGGQGVAAATAVRTASGTATTWTHSSTECNDVSTNAGSGTDISGVVGDVANPVIGDASYAPTLTASQSQTGGAAIVVTLNPLFRLPGDKIQVVVEAAFGADPDSDLSTVTWTDISSSVRPGLRIRKGVLNENGQSDPTRVDFELNNPVGDFTPDDPQSIHWPNIQLDTPIRVSVGNVGIRTYERATAFVDTWAPSWNDGPDWSVVTVSCGGRLQRLQEGRPPIKSPAFRTIVGHDPAPLDYWSLEDGETASSGANALGGHPAAVSSGTFGGETTLPGSAGVVSLAAGGKVIGTVRSYAATGQLWLGVTVKIPSAPTVQTTVLEMFTSGSARRWRLLLTPGSPDLLTVHAYDSGEVQILDTSVSLNGNVREGDVYGKWCQFSLGLTQNGTGVDFEAWIFASTGSGQGKTGTLAGQVVGRLQWGSVTASVEWDGLGVGHLIAVTDPTFDPFLDANAIALVVLSGRIGESAEIRFARLCNEERVPHSIELAPSSVTDSTNMGPQQPGSFVGALRDVETLDAGILHDGGPLGEIVLSQRGSRYNKGVGLTLTGKQIMKDFQPRFDTQARKGEVTASRPNGASYVFASGAPGLQDSIQANVESDPQLPSVASWRSSRGQAKGMRYPSFGIDLRAHPELVKAWLASGISTRVNLNIDLPQHPTTTVDLFIDGYAEELDAARWVVNPINCSPARPQGEVFQLESTVGNRGRLDTAGSKLAADVAAGGVLNSNFDFETTTSPWTVLGGGALTRSTARFHSGSAALLFTPDGVTASPEIRSENVSAVAGTSYLASAWVWCAVSRNVGVGINWRDSGGGLLSSSSTSVAVTAETWTLITITATAPAATALAQLDVFMGSTPPANNLLYIDEARLETNALLVVTTTTGPRWLPGSAVFDLDLGGEQVRVSTIGDAANANPFFETTDAPWTLIGGGTLTRTSTQKHEGSWSLLLTPDGVAAFPEARSENVIGISEGQAWAGSAWVRCAVARNIRIRINWRDADANILSQPNNTFAVAANTWTLITLESTAPAGAALAQLTIFMDSTPPTTHLLYIDEAKLVGPTQPFTVQRGLNGFTKPHAEGDSLSLWQPSVWAL